VQPPPGWRSDGEIFTALLNLIAARSERFDQIETWKRIVADNPRFAGLSWEALGESGLPLSEEEAEGAAAAAEQV